MDTTVIYDFENLSPYDFDQSLKGWRLLDSEGKYQDAATAIEDYITIHVNDIHAQSRVSIQTMYFHAGQEYAMAGKVHYQKAIKNFEMSYKSKDSWDLYVGGTIAFLKNDAGLLRKASEKLALMANEDEKLISNSHLLFKFLDALNTKKDYATVYEED